MKKILLSMMALAVMGIAAKVQAQCTVSNLTVQPLSFDPTTCTITFNVQFDQEVNSGNKFAYIHLWTASQYHTPAANWAGSPSAVGSIYSGPSKQPKAADLVNALGTIAIQFNGTASPTIYNQYPADANVTPITSGISISKVILPGGVTERETISGLSFTLPSCTGVISLKGDIWASQASNGANVHCVSSGLAFDFNNPAIVGAQKVCNPRTIQFGIQNNGTSNITVDYMIYKDSPTLGQFDPGNTDGSSLKTVTGIVIAPGATQGVSLTSADIAALGAPGEKGDYWIYVQTQGSTFSTIALVKNNSVGCAPLPVSLTFFEAKRNGSNVNLTWQTSTERNNSGFAVERNINGTWEQIAFVRSISVGGNSDALLNYAYTDINTVKGITQYRIRQIDFDNRSKYSDVRSIRGEGADVKTVVYPNPSFDGKVNVAFDDAKVVRNVSVLDMSGRVVRQINGITNNNITIENLNPGMYTIRVVVPETGDQGVQKIIVNKR